MKRKNPQLSTTVDHELHRDVVALADKEDRSLSEMTAILVRNAVKERNRKKKKEENAEASRFINAHLQKLVNGSETTTEGN